MLLWPCKASLVPGTHGRERFRFRSRGGWRRRLPAGLYRQVPR